MRFRPAVLIEVLISMALAGLLLTVLLGYFAEMSKAGRLVAESRQELAEERYVQTRLSQVFHRSLVPLSKGKRVVFFTKEAAGQMTEGPSLVFSYDNGAVINPIFSNVVLGRLFVDGEQRLCLATWPLYRRYQPGETIPMQKEVLLDGVHQLEFSFFHPMGDAPGSAEFLTEEEVAHWPIELTSLPVLLTLNINRAGKPLSFSFPLPNSKKHPRLR